MKPAKRQALPMRAIGLMKAQSRTWCQWGLSWLLRRMDVSEASILKKWQRWEAKYELTIRNEKQRRHRAGVRCSGILCLLPGGELTNQS